MRLFGIAVRSVASYLRMFCHTEPRNIFRG